MKKLMCVSLIVLMAVFSAVPTWAGEGQESEKDQGVVIPLFTYISSLDAGLTINSSGKTTCIGNVILSNNSHSTNLTVQLQKSTGSWLEHD